jgi:hypothetical protein
MIGYHYLRGRFIPAKDHVTAHLPSDSESNMGEGLGAFHGLR